MAYEERVAPQAAWADAPAALAFVRQTAAVAEAELHKLRRDPWELLTRAVQPALWLLIFGEVFARVRGITTGGIGYLSFLAPGVLAQSTLFIAIFYGIIVIWERDLGILQKLLVTPSARAALVLGKGLSASVRGLAQAMIVYVLAAAIGVPLHFGIFAIVGVLAFVSLGAVLFSTFSLAIACLLKTRERFMGIGQVLTMPLFFASNAIYPVALMPPWLRVVAAVNPLSYLVDALRTLMVGSVPGAFGLWTDFGVLALLATVAVVVAARLYPKVVR
ncbi:MAG: ABC transporter permease [Gammaproteobacteria bacterium]|nr:ABC transporter permease [Gammaproteobacteria bacterium]